VIRGLLAGTIAALAMAGPAAAGTLKDGSKRSLHVTVITAADGGATSFSFKWRARCHRPRTVLQSITDAQGGGDPALVARGTYTLKQSGGIRARISSHATGRRKSIYAWVGTFSVSAVVKRHGKTIDHCRTANMTWRATAPRASLQLTSDPGDYIGQGKPWSFASPDRLPTVHGDREHVYFGLGGFSVDIDAPGHQRLRPGRYAGATRYPFNDTGPGLDVNGPGRGCNELSGEFTIRSISFDRHGRLRALDIVFEQHCENFPAAVRGTATYQAG
jgi:hypothetical protein